MKLKIYTDWWSRWNPGSAWCWVYITDENNNEAEYLWVYYAIKRVVELWHKDIEIYADSKLVVEQMSWKWKIKAPNLAEIKKELDLIIKQNSLNVTYFWIPREQNKEADRLSNVAMDGNITP